MLFQQRDGFEPEFATENAEIDAREIPNFLNIFRGIPIQASQAKRPIDATDHLMMANSYSYLDRGQPREMGKVKLLDSEGRILDQSGIIMGSKNQIIMNENIIFLLNKNLHLAQEIAKVEITHTHPRGFRASVLHSQNLGQNHEQFSEGDFREDKKILDFLKSRPAFQHIYIESYILFLLKNLVVPELVDENIFDGALGIKGYRLR